MVPHTNFIWTPPSKVPISHLMTLETDTYLTRGYYDQYKVAGLGQFRHISPEPHFPGRKYPKLAD